MDISEEEVANTLSISQAHLSLDAPLTPGEDNKLLDYLPDTTNPGPDDEIFEHALTESIEGVLATLKEREAKILRLYFGLEGQEPMTLEEIGSLLGITRERVRQIKEKALARLRHVAWETHQPKPTGDEAPAASRHPSGERHRAAREHAHPGQPAGDGEGHRQGDQRQEIQECPGLDPGHRDPRAVALEGRAARG